MLATPLIVQFAASAIQEHYTQILTACVFASCKFAQKKHACNDLFFISTHKHKVTLHSEEYFVKKAFFC